MRLFYLAKNERNKNQFEQFHFNYYLRWDNFVNYEWKFLNFSKFRSQNEICAVIGTEQSFISDRKEMFHVSTYYCEYKPFPLCALHILWNASELVQNPFLSISQKIAHHKIFQTYHVCYSFCALPPAQKILAATVLLLKNYFVFFLIESPTV